MLRNLTYYLLVCCLFFASDALAGRTKRAFNNLQIYNYFAAKKQFEKMRKRKPAAASFGLSIIYQRTDNPFHNLDSAYNYAFACRKYFEKLSEKNKEKMLEYKIHAKAIDSLFHLICQKAFQKALDSNDVSYYAHFISHFSDAPQRIEAISKRNELAFQQARSMLTSDALCRYTETYPDAEQVPLALQLFEKLLYAEHTKNGSLEEYIFFASEYPNSPYKSRAEDEIFNLFTREGSIEKYAEFIKQFPDNPNTDIAWRNIYALYTSSFTREKILSFKNAYPHFPFMQELESDLILADMEFFPVTKDSLWGFIDANGVQHIKPAFSAVSNFSEGIAVVSKNMKKGYINKKGAYIVAPVFDDAEPFVHNYAVVMRDDKYGAIDKTGKLVVPPVYDYIGEYRDSLFAAEKDEKYGYVGAKGKTAIPFIYDAAGDFENGYAYVQIADKKGIINKKGINVLRCEYDWIDNMQQGLIRVIKDGQFGVLNVQGDTIVPIAYAYIGPFRNNRAMLAENDKYGFVPASGKKIIAAEFSFDHAAKEWGDFQNGYALFKQKNKFGLIDTNGKKVLEPKYDLIGKAGQNKFVPVLQKDKWTYVSLSAKQAPGGKFEQAGGFSEHGLALVKIKDVYHLLHEKGHIITEEGYEKIEWKGHTIFVMRNGMYGLLDNKGKELLKPIYKSLHMLNEYLVRAETDEGYIYINLSLEKIIWPHGE